MKIKSVIFDLDGTLLDTIEDIADANNQMLCNNGFPEHELDKYIDWIGNGARKLVVESLPADMDFSMEQENHFLRQYSSIYSYNIDVKTKLYNGIANVLDEITDRSIIISINTNKPQALTEIVCEKYLTNWPFRFVYGQNGKFNKKPDPQAALAIVKDLGIPEENTLFVGDSAVDVKTANNAGMASIGVRWGYGNKKLMEEAGAAAMIDDPAEIVDFIDANN